MFNNNKPMSLLFLNDYTSAFLVLTWIGLLIYVITLTSQKPVDEDDPDYELKATEFSNITTIFTLVSFIIYFRFFPLGWKSTGTMKFINLIIAIVTTTFLLIFNHKKKTKGIKNKDLSPFEAYKKNLGPFISTIFVLAAYSLTGTVNNFFGEISAPGFLGVPAVSSTLDFMFAPKK